ncbi:hypothetical protein FACS1894169_14040 [Bacteroidia bacterium]|nr:hypothetical protein FACS1894169_14040 [Bacteroidia bacterium]
MTRKKILMSAVAILAAANAFAQGNGIGGITEATNMAPVISTPVCDTKVV